MKTLQRGFSLIELMIVIAIIGILASVAVPSYQNYVLKARTAELLTLIQAGQTMVAEYVATTGDTGCNNIVQPSVPGNVDDFFIRTDFDCAIEVDALSSNFGGTTFDIWYSPNFEADDSISSWTCWYARGDSARADYVSPSCINYAETS